MSDVEVETMKAHQEVATRNSKAAVKRVEMTRDELLDRVEHLDQLVQTLGNRITLMEQKYNLLLSARFDGRATAG